MKEPANQSPFAALNPREQKEQWIWWQCQHPKEENAQATAEMTGHRDLPALKLPGRPDDADLRNEEVPVVQHSRSSLIHHGQYDAVVRRMNAARKQVTTAYIPWTE